jgi:NitT/TauT family transport system ATP-binding protein
MIEAKQIRKTFHGSSGHDAAPTVALADVDLRVPSREFVCLLGPSGCGKTTLLKLIAGLILPDSGQILIDGTPVTGPGQDRGLVFQNFALLPWADVLTNVAFGLELRGVAKAEREAIAHDLLQTVGLAGFERHYPRQLSGGMQQRVGLARALAINPNILLMDEPFSAVDSQTRRLLQEDLLTLHDSTNKTVVFVTHDMDEAVRLGDRVVLMSPRPGRIQEEIEVKLPRPRSPDVEKRREFVELKEYLWQQLRAMRQS